MKLKTASVTYGRKVNLGDFNSAHAELTLWADFEEDENEADAMTALWEMATNNVKAKLSPLMMKKDADVQHIFMGLPVQVRNQLQENE